MLARCDRRRYGRLAGAVCGPKTGAVPESARPDSGEPRFVRAPSAFRSRRRTAGSVRWVSYKRHYHDNILLKIWIQRRVILSHLDRTHDAVRRRVLLPPPRAAVGGPRRVAPPFGPVRSSRPARNMAKIRQMTPSGADANQNLRPIALESLDRFKKRASKADLEACCGGQIDGFRDRSRQELTPKRAFSRENLRSLSSLRSPATGSSAPGPRRRRQIALAPNGRPAEALTE